MLHTKSDILMESDDANRRILSKSMLIYVVIDLSVSVLERLVLIAWPKAHIKKRIKINVRIRKRDKLIKLRCMFSKLVEIV